MKEEYDDMGAMFDTHEFVTEMTNAKMPPRQAELLAKTYANLLNDRLATKEDLKSLRTELKAEMDANKAELKAEMDANKAELTNAILRAQITTIIASVGLTSTIVGVMFALVQTFGG